MSPISPEELRHQEVLAERARQARPETIEGFRYKLGQMAREKGSFAPGTPAAESREALRAMEAERAGIHRFAEGSPGLQEALNRLSWEDLEALDEAAARAEHVEASDPEVNFQRGRRIRGNEALKESILDETIRGGRARAVLGRLSQRAMQIPGVRPTIAVGRAAGRFIGPALGAAGPFFDAMAVKELSDQYEEAKEGMRHAEATRMHAARNYATPLAAKQTRKRLAMKAKHRRNVAIPYNVQQTLESPTGAVYLSPEERFGY